MNSLLAIGLAALSCTAPSAGNTFELSVARASAYGTYDQMMSIPERPVPPVAVNGTLALNGRGCAVTQLAYNGPTDGIEWRTLATLCRPGKTNFQARSELLWGGSKPSLRLCAGRTAQLAERSNACDVFTPASDIAPPDPS